MCSRRHIELNTLVILDRTAFVTVNDHDVTAKPVDESRSPVQYNFSVHQSKAVQAQLEIDGFGSVGEIIAQARRLSPLGQKQPFEAVQE